MKRFLFSPKLAWEGICKNRRLYVPYLLSCIGMVMMSYIMHALASSPSVQHMPGGGNAEAFLSLGQLVIALFALLFLFYTNSFLTRRRYREYGLYSILGMDRHAISRIVVWESLIVTTISLGGGMGLGILFSKLAELGLMNAVRGEIDYCFTIQPDAIKYTLIIYVVIFALLMLRSMFSIRRSRPLELLRSENVGEKAPKANWIFALIGLVVLGWAYWISVSIQTPLAALVLFFIAVLMVIVGTYLLFMSGSVVLCKMLQKNKRYYYRKEHFVSVSSMAYRMKRNGAGLASICILATMVLVMIASSSSLYFGADDAIRTRFPVHTQLEIHRDSLDDMADDKLTEVRSRYAKVFERYAFTPNEVQDYRYAVITGMMRDSDVELDSQAVDASLFGYDNLRMLYFVSAADYNQMMNTTWAPNAGEALVYPIRCTYDRETIHMGDVLLQVIGQPEQAMPIAEAYTTVIPSLIVIVPDYDTIRPLEALADYRGDQMLSWHWYYGYNWIGQLDEDTAMEIFEAQRNVLVDFYICDGEVEISTSCIAAERNDFYSTFGGLFFLGLILSAVFIFAAVVIIYYKQISEGYEDQKRFAIMRKVGMSDCDIRKSINSQVLTVFFAPLLFAGLHLSFAFPFVWKLLQLFNLRNLTLVIWITVGAFAVFGVIYGMIYKLTAGAYYRIVSSADNV